MIEHSADHVIIGSSLLARLLAGLLAATHGQRVIFVGQSQSGYRLPRGLDISIGAFTRPESWALLRDGLPELNRLLGRIGGRSAWQHIDPILFAGNADCVEALSHIRHMATAFDMNVEPAPTASVGNDRSGIMMRDAVYLQQTVLEPILDRWLAQSGVRHLAPQRVTVDADGSTRLQVDGADVLARHAILADSEAITTHLPLRQWPTLFRRMETSTILTRPTRPLAAPVMIDADTGAVLHQLTEGGIVGIGRGDLAHFSALLQALLGGERLVEQVGQTAYQRLWTLDGAPAVGRVADSGADIICALEPYGAFLAPALARWIAGVASAAESNWFGNRLVTRGTGASPVADFMPPAAGTAQ